MMRAVTPELKLFAAALPDTSWTVPLLKEAGYLLDYVSIHGYWDPLWAINNVSPYIDCMMRTTAPENDIGSENRVIPVQMQFEIINEAISLPPHSLSFFTFE